MARFSDIVKKGTGVPTPSDLVVGGIGIDIASGLVYSKKQDNSIFSMGNGILDIVATGGVNPGDDTTLTVSFDDGRTDKVFTAKGGAVGATGAIGATFSVSGDVLTITT